MSADILEGLRVKEEEMAVVIEDARLKAAAIRESAVRQAKEIKTAREIEAQALIREVGTEQDRIMRQEAATLEAQALETAKGLTIKGGSRLEEAVKEVIRIVSGPYKGHA